MTKRTTCFDNWSTSVIGVNEPGWTVRGGGAPGFAPKYGLETVVPRAERYAEFVTDSTSDYRFRTWDVLDTDGLRATFSIATAFMMDLTTVEEIHIYARGVSTTDFVRARIVKATGAIAIDKMVGGAYTAGSGSSAGTVTLTAGHSYIVMFDGNLGRLRLWVWDAELGAAGQPIAANLRPNGFTPTGVGFMGWGGRHSTLTGKVAPTNFFATSTHYLNLLLAGAEFDDTVWSNTSITVVPNVLLAPDGKISGSILANSAGSTAKLTQNVVATRTSHVYSIYLRPDGAPTAFVKLRNTTTATDLSALRLDLSTGGITIVTGTGSVEPAPYGWYRLILPASSGITIGDTLTAHIVGPDASAGIGETFGAWGARIDENLVVRAFESRAVVPIMDWEFDAELRDQSVKRCITMTLPATGYDSTTPPYTKTVFLQVSNLGYNAHEQDGLSNSHFRSLIATVPTFNIDLPGIMSGPANTNIGDLVLRNPRGAKKRYINYVLQSCAFDTTPWSGTATVTAGSSTPPTGCKRADLLTDASAVAYSNRAQQVSVTNDSATWYYAIRVKKTTGGTAKTFGINFYLSGGTTVNSTPRLNTDTGATASTGNVAVQETEDGEYWLWTISVTNNSSGNNLLVIDMYPAVATWPGADSAATTGSVTVSGAHLWREPGALYAGTTSAAANFVKAGGRLDDLLRYAWRRDPQEMRLGNPLRAWHDHRVILRYRVGMATAPSPSRIAFKLADLSDILNQDVNPILFTSGEYTGQRKPELFGNPAMFEPPMTDIANQEFTLSRRAIVAGSKGTQNTGVAYNTGVPITAGPFTVSVTDNATDELTLSATHGMVVDYVFQYTAGTLPTVTGAALALDTDLFVVAVPAPTKVKLSRTLGGAAIDFTNNTAGQTVTGFGYRFSPAAAATMRLVNSPAGGRITVYAQDAGGNKLGQIYAAMAFDSMALSANYKDQISFDALDAAYSTVMAGMWIGTEKVTGADAFKMFADATFTWFACVPNGRIQVGRYSLPSATAAATVGDGEILEGSMTLVDVIRPVDMSKAELTYSPFFLTKGFLVMAPGTSVALQQNKIFLTPYSYGATSTPLENYPTLMDANTTAKYTTFVTDGAGELQTYLAEFHKWKLGIFAPVMRLRAVMFKLGSTIRVKHGRLGWEVYNAQNPASPDNATTMDSELCYIAGKSFKFKRAFPITLKLARPIHANFPIADITD